MFVSDVEQMYRQILVHPDDQKFQQILWRNSLKVEIGVWSLQTVTCGIICSPFMAIRVMRQLAKDEGIKFLLRAKIVSEETYIDDALSGGHGLEKALSKKYEIIQICKVGGFNLHKWLANEKMLLNVTQSLRVDYNLSDSCFGLLGLDCNPLNDYFSIFISIDQFKGDITKRKVLSSIAKIYDPLGWLAPVVITAKIFIQKLWLAKIDWDDILPIYLKNEFLSWYNNISALNEFKINRWIGYTPDSKYEIYGFSDASKVGFGACVYLKVINKENTVINLIQAKSKVAPIKPILTTPKLELIALLLYNLHVLFFIARRTLL